MSESNRFYMTYARTRPNEIVPYAERNNVPMLSNIFHRWSDAQEKLLDIWEYDCPHVIDSGGFNVMANGYNEFPWSVKEYHQALVDYGRMEWAACMDYACEERFDDVMTVRERMERTVRNCIAHYDLDPEYKVLPILQGRCLEDYLWCYEKYREFGIPVEHVGLGTVCRISSSKRIVNLEQNLREKTSIDRIHGFGVKIDALKMGATFDSMDSQAWVWAASNGQVYRDDGTSLVMEPMPDDSKTRTVESFKNYYDYVSRLME